MEFGDRNPFGRNVTPGIYGFEELEFIRLYNQKEEAFRTCQCEPFAAPGIVLVTAIFMQVKRSISFGIGYVNDPKNCMLAELWSQLNA